MTRETKIGMSVAGSFLSLVGAVVGTKLYKGDIPDPRVVVAGAIGGKGELPPPTPAPGGAPNLLPAAHLSDTSIPPLTPTPGQGFPTAPPAGANAPKLPAVPTPPPAPPLEGVMSLPQVTAPPPSFGDIGQEANRKLQETIKQQEDAARNAAAQLQTNAIDQASQAHKDLMARSTDAIKDGNRIMTQGQDAIRDKANELLSKLPAPPAAPNLPPLGGTSNDSSLPPLPVPPVEMAQLVPSTSKAKVTSGAATPGAGSLVVPSTPIVAAPNKNNAPAPAPTPPGVIQVRPNEPAPPLPPANLSTDVTGGLPGQPKQDAPLPPAGFGNNPPPAPAFGNNPTPPPAFGNNLPPTSPPSSNLPPTPPPSFGNLPVTPKEPQPATSTLPTSPPQSIPDATFPPAAGSNLPPVTSPRPAEPAPSSVPVIPASPPPAPPTFNPGGPVPRIPGPDTSNTLPVPPFGSVPPASVKTDTADRYVCQGNETYELIAARKLGSDRYARALEQYNREMPGAPENLRASPARLGPNTVVWVPTLQYLMDRYGQYLASGAPIPASPTAAPPRSLAADVGIRAPTPLVPANNAPAAQPPVGTTTFRVPAGGMLISQVAASQLGDALRWIDIYRLNPSIDPSQPIREGTEIRVPMRQ